MYVKRFLIYFNYEKHCLYNINNNNNIRDCKDIKQKNLIKVTRFLKNVL